MTVGTQVSEMGTLTPELWQRAARPWTYDGEDEPFLYDEVVRTKNQGLNQLSATYRIVRRPNPNYGVPEPTENRPIRLDERAAQLATQSQTDAPVTLSIKLRDFPDWNIPPRIPAELFTNTQVQAVEAERVDAMEARRLLFEQQSASVRAAVGSTGGRVVSTLPEIGWLKVEVPATAVASLALHDDLLQINADVEDGGDDCSSTCTLRQQSNWKLGSGDSANSPGGRDEERLDANTYINAGATGSSGAENGRYLAAVVEHTVLEDEALAFNANSFGTSRIQGKYGCSSSGCYSVLDFNDENLASDHGTMVSNVLLGDFENDQAAGVAYGDDCWDGISHCDDWEEAASGMAPEAALVFYEAGGGSAVKEEAYLHAATVVDYVDVINSSNATYTVDCDITSSRADEDAVEVAFDEGVFFVTSAGNNNSGGSTTCDLDAPGDTPKAFAVNAYDVGNSNCASDMNDCDLDANKHRMGGMDAPLPSGTVSGAITGVDTMAPHGSSYNLDQATPNGIVEDHFTNDGTSAAAPHVSGLALLLKDWLRDNQNWWIENPGRLHTMMLAHADRADGVQQARNKGGDVLWGFGRSRLQTGATQGLMRTISRSTTGTTSFLLDSSPTPSNTALVKCVMLEDEDMSGKSTVGDVTLEVTLREPVSGVCSQSGTIRGSARWDGSYDLKHMVRFHDKFTNLDNVCVDVDVDFYQIAGSSITTHVYCRASSVHDTAP